MKFAFLALLVLAAPLTLASEVWRLVQGKCLKTNSFSCRACGMSFVPTSRYGVRPLGYP